MGGGSQHEIVAELASAAKQEGGDLRRRVQLLKTLSPNLNLVDTHGSGSSRKLTVDIQTNPRCMSHRP